MSCPFKEFSLKQQLNDKEFPNLTIFSRKQRETMQAIEKELTEAMDADITSTVSASLGASVIFGDDQIPEDGLLALILKLGVTGLFHVKPSWRELMLKILGSFLDPEIGVASQAAFLVLPGVVQRVDRWHSLSSTD